MAVQGRESEDRRRGERHSINPELAAQGSSLIYVSDLSEYGVFIHTRVRLPVGAAVDLNFTVLLDDPVVIHGPGRVVHHQDEPRGMGVAFSNLSAVMQLRVIDAINWYRARNVAVSEQAFRTRELSADELTQIDEDGEDGDESSTDLSSSDLVAESGAYASMNASIEALGAEEVDAALAASSGSRRGPLARSPAATPAPMPAPAKDDEYEDF